MRLLDRNDTSLMIALVASALVIFQKPLHVLIEAAHGVELRYNIDLLPGLVVLVGALAFHEYGRRQQARAVAERAAGDVAQERGDSGPADEAPPPLPPPPIRWPAGRTPEPDTTRIVHPRRQGTDPTTPPGGRAR